MITYNPYIKKNCFLPALIGGFAGLLGSAIGSATSSSNMRKQNEFNAQQAEIDRQWRETMWNKENEYNTPSAQLARIRDAGLSPGLMYQNGGSFSQASVPSGSQARAAESQRTYFDPSIAVQMALQAMQIEQNVKTQKQQASTQKAVEEETKERTRGKRIENDITEQSQQYLVEANKYDAEFKEYQSKTQKEESEKRSYESQRAKWDAERSKTELDYLVQEKELNIQAIETQMNNQTRLVSAQISNLKSGEVLNYAKAVEANSNAVLNRVKAFEVKLGLVPKTLGMIQDYRNKIKQGVNLVKQGRIDDAKELLINAQTGLQNEIKDYTRQRKTGQMTENDRQQLKYVTDLLSTPLDVIF